MYKITKTYIDYNGVERTEDFFFNFSKAELFDMEFGTMGGLSAVMKKIVDAKETHSLVNIFKELLLKSYGEKSPDGKRFMKSEEISTAFSQTEAYSEIYMTLATDSDAASDFINNIIPKDLAADVEKYNKGGVNVADIRVIQNK